MFSEFFNALLDTIWDLPLPSMGGLTQFIVLMLVAPIILGLLTSWGDWKSTGLACTMWYGGMGLWSISNNGEAAAFAFLYVALFSILAVPILSFVIKIIR